MEMHQVRYFLALSREFNFTRAAEACCVSQPTLTRAIKQLEDEFGGELFRRERRLTHLTELGQRMMPILQNCEDSASSAKALAKSIKAGTTAPLALAISHSVNMSLLIPILKDLSMSFDGLDLVLLRGSQEEVAQYLKAGAAELAIADTLDQKWDRFVSWPLFSEAYQLAFGRHHRFANQSAIEVADLAGESLVIDKGSEITDVFQALLKQHNVQVGVTHETATPDDCMAMIAAGIGAGIVPHGASSIADVARLPINGLALIRSVAVYGVTGRQRSSPGTTLLRLLRSANGHLASPASGAQDGSQLH